MHVWITMRLFASAEAASFAERGLRHAERLADAAHLVGEGDLERMEGVARVLEHLCRPDAAGLEFAWQMPEHVAYRRDIAVAPGPADLPQGSLRERRKRKREEEAGL